MENNNFNVEPSEGFEEWKDLECLKGFYQVSNYARVRNVKTGKIMTPTRQKRSGYYYVTLQIEKPVCFRLNRLVAKAFVNNPMPLIRTEVHHLNGIKSDNYPSNLKWVSHSENMLHCYNVLHRSRVITEETKQKIRATLKKRFENKKLLNSH